MLAVDDFDRIFTWVRYRKTANIEAVKMAAPFEVDTLEGTMKGKEGDYLVRGARGELYPVDKEIFEATYVVVD